MLNNYFLTGFADELTKEAAHPMFASLTRGGTMLGRKVKGMMFRAYKKGMKKRYKMKKKAQQMPAPDPTKSKDQFAPMKPAAGQAQPMPAGKPQPKPTPIPGAEQKPKPMPATGPAAMPMGKLSAEAGRAVKSVLEQATPAAQARRSTDDGARVLETGAEDTRYGGGLGNLGGKRAPAFTDKVNPTDTPKAF